LGILLTTKALVISLYSSEFHWGITTTWTALAVINLFFAGAAVGAWSQLWYTTLDNFDIWATELAFDVIGAFWLMVLIPLLAFKGQNVKN